MINETHDPQRRSWVESANAPEQDFPLQNLPVGLFSRDGSSVPRPGIAIGDQVLDLAECADLRLIPDERLSSLLYACVESRALNPLMAAGKSAAEALRNAAFRLLDGQLGQAVAIPDWRGRVLVRASGVQMHLPCRIGGYTDFLTSAYHTERHGRFKGLDVPLPPVFKSLPVAYHGRASSIRVSGHHVHRPHGQWRGADGQACFGAAQALDFELELAAFVGQGNELGTPIPLDDASSHIFGYCLLNDWSSKQVQWWEQMLGPFLGKSFGTTISPWIVTEEALAPFRKAAAAGDPAPMAYLASARHTAQGGLNLALQASLHTQSMRQAGQPPERIVDTHLDHLYWTFPQMLTHHASNGCNLQAGDLLGSGTVSGPSPASMACMTEKTEAGRVPFMLANGESRLWLADDDEVILTARASRKGFVSIGFGECRARLLPARPWPSGEPSPKRSN